MTRALDLSWGLGGRALGEDPEWRQMCLAFLCYANKMLRALASLVQSCLEPGITPTYPVTHPVSQSLS